MCKRNLFICVLFFLIGSSLWAGGGKDNVSKSAEDPSGFTDTLDISEKKPGKYNYYMEATDRAGNVTLAGPDNIYIDPESDLPRTTIINPLPSMRVQGNMNIVGIAFDDDGIKNVEIAVYRGTDGKGEEITRVTANGTDYWSYFLDTSDGEIWRDGDYTVKAWSTDINDLPGNAAKYPNGDKVPEKNQKIAVVYWRLDRKKPETTITSHSVGALVSGNIRLSGKVTDGNGIAAINYSVDGGVKYAPAKLKIDKRNGNNTWEASINTKQFEDGPVVIWFKARDGNNSIGTAAHLLFVNNTGPDVKIVYPEPGTTVNGVFSIAGYAKHPVGLKSVTWKAGTQQGEFELLAGNHWWSADVDARGLKGNAIEVEIKAVDVSGNTTVVKQKYKLDQAADMPVVSLDLPKTGILENKLGLVVKGKAVDKEGVASIFYSLDGTPPEEIPCSGYFQFIIPTPAEGTHILDVWAKDVTGITGNKTQVKGIVVSNAVIQPGIANFTWPEGKTTKVDIFYTGMKIRPVPKMTMALSYKAPTAPKSATITFGDQSPVPVKLSGSKDVFTATIPVPSSLQEGLMEIKLTGTDRQDKEFTYSEFVFVTNQPPPAADEEPQPFVASNNTFTWVRQTALNDGRILLKEGETLMGISSVPVINATLQGTGANLLNVSVDQNGMVLLTAVSEGETGQLTLKLDVDGGTFNSGQFRVVAEAIGPVVTLQNIENYKWIKNSVPVTFNITSKNKVSAVDVSLDMGDNWQNLLTAAELAAIRAPLNSNYTKTLDLTAAEDGSINILIRAANESGLDSVANFSVLKDTQAPQAQNIMPIAEAGVNGTIRMAFAVEEMGAIQSITYNRTVTTPARAATPAVPAAPGRAAVPASPAVPASTTNQVKEIFNDNQWEKDYAPRFFEVLMDSLEMPLDKNMRFIFTDKAGNSSEVNTWLFVIDQEMDVPIVQIILPIENEVITNDFIVSGVMFDDDGVKNYQWKIDNNQWQTEDAEYGFSIPVALSTLTDNDHTISVIAEDIYGVKSQPVTRVFRVSLNEPTATMTYPLYDTVLKEGIEIRGTASDKNGIRDVRASIDNGNSFNFVKGNYGTAAETIQWSYQFNTTILKDGPHVVFIKVYDRYDIPATYAFMINVDNTQPEIILDSPGDGSITVGNISVMGRILDPNLKEVSIELRSLDGFTIPANLRLRKLDLSSMIRENIDIAAMADGQYNVAIIATDRAGNMTRLSRNVQMARQTYRNYIEILYPLENEETSGEFNLYGFAGGANPAGTVTIKINGNDLDTVPVDDSGYFVFKMDGEKLNAGVNAITVNSNFGGPTLVSSRPYNLIYRDGGPWVTIDLESFTFGKFAYERPYLYGRTGYVLSEEDQELLKDKTAEKAVKARILAKTPKFTEISFDNGRSFIMTSKASAKNIDYRYRLEDGEMAEGYHYIVVRTTMKNGEFALTRMLVQVDKTKPEIRLISPEAGSRYNQKIAYSASATDDIELVSLTYHLRAGDKAAYEVPGFLQGLYIEGVIPPFYRQLAVSNGIQEWAPSMPFAGGATYTDFGFGLSFFDDNVKIQGQYGFLTQELYDALGGEGPVRYGGDVIGLKILANVYTLPLGSVWGPDFDWLYASFSIGANFSLFNFLNKENPDYSPNKDGELVYYTQSGESTWLSALLLQIEFPKVTIPKKKAFRTFSLFTEGQLWFVPTDVKASQMGIKIMIPHVMMGLRIYIF
ncbi:Ig-like domain-containing protein [Treponema sp. R80B11-R83G3]